MGTFFMFGGINFALLFYVWIFLPETAGVSLEEMDDNFKYYKIGFRKIPCRVQQKY